MHRIVLGRSFATLVAPVLLCVLAHKLLNRRRASVQRIAEDASASSSSISPRGNNYDVFLSFRGMDTRLGFTDHLYRGLVDGGIRVFADDDDDELRMNKGISPDLLETIKKSKILIPIISPNYSSSKWCLDELVHMMECNKHMGHIVMPIFYQVEPADLRYEIGRFGEALHKYGRRFDQKVVQKWKQALFEVSCLRGWDATHGQEGKLVKLIVQRVLNELKTGTMLSYITENLVGIDSHVEKVMELINKSSSATLCVGIHGSAGIGKTTLAKIIYNKLFILFEHHSFIADIRESCNCKGIEHLQSKLISDILKKWKQVDNKDEGINFISSKFKDKKVLILLDDVDTTNQLEALVGNSNWFASGSKIIVTTRDESVLDRARVDIKYEPKKMDEEHGYTEDHNPGPPSPSILPIHSHYEVFLSFKGSDTRRAFIDILYQSLVDAGIHVFRDDSELSEGDRLSLGLQETIENSEILIPIISENYASSKWCLDGLVHMMKCKKRLLPIFYKVKPTQVQHQTGYFGEAFHYYHQGRGFDQQDVEKWKQALVEIGSLKGWESEKVANGHEGNLAKLIVQKVLNELKTGAMLLCITENLVGIDSHVKKVMELVNKSSSATLCVGIHGWAGIGKTTLAKVIYNKLLIHFEHHIFIADIRESCKYKDIEFLQSKLISDILGKRKQVHNKDEGINFISSKFNDEKVLILLDDVDTTSQLKALAGNTNWFAPGSRIIVTTRDESVLDSAIVDVKYELKKMNEEQSLILFSRHAFRRDCPPNKFYDLSRVVVSTIGGLPLDLIVVGSFLYGKAQALWADAIEKMQNSTHRAVQDSLRMNYEMLEDAAKDIFLDIACCLIGSDARVAFHMWDACGFYPRKEIEVLRSLSFIRIGDNHELVMHGQMKDLGRQIVHEESYSKPHKRSRLWHYEEALEVLESKKGTEKIQAICLDEGNPAGVGIMDQESRVFTDEQFRNLPSLRLLHISDVNLTGDFNEVFSKLRWLKWANCPPTFAAKNFHVGELVILDLSGSSISDKWQGWISIMSAKKLKVLNLTGCSSLESTSFLSAFENLEILILRNCDKLEEINPSIGTLKTLVTLDLSGCSRLHKLPEIKINLGLEELLLDQTMIREIPLSIGYLEKLKTLSAKDCKLLHRLPDSICRLGKLSTLDLSGCAELAELPDDIGFLVSLRCLSLGSCHKLRGIPNSIGELKLLTQMNLRGCSGLEELPLQMGKLKLLKELLLDQTMIREIPSIIGYQEKLETLSAKDCKLLRRFPDSIHHMVNLSTLVFSGCVELAALPDSVGALGNLRCLSLGHCHRLREIPNSIGMLKLLTQLDLSGCSCLEELPPQMGKLEQLRKLLLDRTMIREIPSSIGSLKNLETLSAKDCKYLRRLPDSIGHLVNLSTLVLSGCVELVALQDSIGLLVNIRCLSMGRCHQLREIPKSIVKLKLLTRLDLSGCSSLEELPPQMGKLEQLKELLLDQTMIREIPSSIGSLQNLETLTAKNCKLLRRVPDSIGHLVKL